MLATLALMMAGQPGPDLSTLEAEIKKRTFPKVTSVLINHKGSLIYEKYFGDGRRDHLNDTRSVTKTVTALIAGISGKDKRIDIAAVDVRQILNASNPHSTWTGATLADLMTMSSPIDANDSDSKSPGREDAMHEQDHWLRWGLSLPAAPGLSRGSDGYFPFRYATINAVLAGQVVQKIVSEPLDQYIVNKLFKPLAIKNYKFQKSRSGEVMSGGGLRLRSRDLVTLGRLLLDNGTHKGKQVVPTKWIEKMLTPYRRDTVMKGVDYGYFIWSINFGSEEGRDRAWCMLGNGGNIVAMFPKRNLVIVLTRTDYNSGSTAGETFKIIGQLILPKLAG